MVYYKENMMTSLNIKRIGLSTLIFLLLTACGGGGSNSVEDVNTAPVVSISTKNTSVLEGMSIELNATVSDKENDTLDYKWVQLSGESVSLVNEKSTNPSFIAPEVATDSNVSFELSVYDGKDTSVAKIFVNIIDEVKVEKRHEVKPLSSSASVTDGVVKIDYNYNKNPITEITSGLVLNVYWDSSKLGYTKVTESLLSDYMGVSAIKDDVDDKDSNSETDKYITVSWVNLAEGNWKIPASLPTALFSIEMKSIEGASGTTTLNLKTNVDSPGLAFYGGSVIVRF